MKVSIYFDVSPWHQSCKDLAPTCNPSCISSLAGTKRYRIDTEIPDPASPDVVLTGEAVEVARAKCELK